MNKTRLLLYLTIGNLLAALAWNFPVDALNWDDLGEGMRNGINSLAAGESQAQSPLSVPTAQPPIGNPGNSASIQPCAAAPSLPTPVATNALEEMPTSIGKRPKPVASIQPIQPAQFVPPSSERIEYNQGGSITQRQADRMSRYSKPQSRKAMISLLGAPNYFDTHSDVYTIQGTSDGVVAARRLIVNYDLDPNSSYTVSIATNWYQQ
jgi:hypothetical protein